MKTIQTRFAVALAGLALAFSAVAQNEAASPTEAKLQRTDASFLRQAAENGHTEVEGSKLALQKATDPQVKAFAQQMVDDHTKAGNELKALASSKGVKVSDSPSLVQRGKLKVLAGREGANFDDHYASSVGVKAHEDTVKLFRKAANDAKDPEVKAFAAKTLPTLEHHLQMAKELKAGTERSAKTVQR